MHPPDSPNTHLYKEPTLPGPDTVPGHPVNRAQPPPNTVQIPGGEGSAMKGTASICLTVQVGAHRTGVVPQWTQQGDTVSFSWVKVG